MIYRKERKLKLTRHPAWPVCSRPVAPEEVQAGAAASESTLRTAEEAETGRKQNVNFCHSEVVRCRRVKVKLPAEGCERCLR